MTQTESQIAIQRAYALYRECRFLEAVAVLDRALASDPEDGKLWAMKSIVCAEARQYVAALEAAEHVCALEPDSAVGWGLRANALWHLGRLREATASVDRALTLDPHSPDAHGIKAAILRAQQDYHGALTSIEEALRLAPADARAIALGLKATILDRLGDLPGALATFEEGQRLPNLTPIERAGLWIGQGEMCARHRRWSEAEEAYRQALVAAPAHVGALTALVDVQDHVKHLSATLEAVHAVEAAVPEHGAAHKQARYLEARVLMRLHRPGEALAVLNELVGNQDELKIMPIPAERLDALRVYALAQRGWALLDLRRYESALADFERALALRPNWRRCLVGKGRTLIRLHRWREAWETFQQYMHSPPDV